MDYSAKITEALKAHFTGETVQVQKSTTQRGNRYDATLTNVQGFAAKLVLGLEANGDVTGEFRQVFGRITL